MKNNKGFTLIELLVVVLIIGILAAIALPQYFKAVAKSRAAEALMITKNVKDAAARYSLAQGNPTKYPTTFTDLDINITSKTQHYSYSISNGKVTATPNDATHGAVIEYTFGESGTQSCSGGSDGICASLGF